MNVNSAKNRGAASSTAQDKLIFATALCVWLAFSPPAWSQAGGGAEPPIETVIVTGSRIAAPSNRNSSQPLSVVDADAFADSGALLVSEALNQLPQLGNALENGTSIIALNNGFGAGTQTVNLRNLGANRTLALVNGRRHVGGDVGTSAVDLSMIPSGLIDRIDIVTGAASSVYGADAVTGVINVILKENFEGTAFAGRAGGTADGGGEEYAFTATHGGVFDTGGLHTRTGIHQSRQDIGRGPRLWAARRQSRDGSGRRGRWVGGESRRTFRRRARRPRRIQRGGKFHAAPPGALPAHALSFAAKRGGTTGRIRPCRIRT